MKNLQKTILAVLLLLPIASFAQRDSKPCAKAIESLEMAEIVVQMRRRAMFTESDTLYKATPLQHDLLTKATAKYNEAWYNACLVCQWGKCAELITEPLPFRQLHYPPK